MTSLRVLLSRIAGLFGRASSERRLAEEIEAHLEMLTDEHVARGLSRNAAEAAARRSFGGVEQVKERYRDQRGLPFVDALRQDVGFGLRVLVKERGINAVVVLVLGLGIGANTAVFSLVDSVLLKSLPVKDPERLVHVTFSPEAEKNYWATYPAWERLRDLDLFDGAVAWSSEPFTDPDGESVLWASSGFFDVLGVAAALGRTFHDGPGSGARAAVAVISDGLWKRRFGGEESVLGRSITVERTPFTIIGVTGPEFFGPDVGRRFDVAVPLESMPLLPGRRSSLENPPRLRVRIMARLRPDQTLEDATLALRQAQPRVREETVPGTWRAESRENYLKDPWTALPAANGVSSVRSRYQDPLLVLMAVTGLVLVIACGNLASLLLARASGRSRELGIRSAMGASRFRLGRQLFVEALLLSCAASAVGLFTGHAASRLLASQMTTVLESVYVALSLDARVLAFAMTAACVTAIVVGVVPAFRASKVATLDALSERPPAPSSPRFGPGGLLVVTQVAVSLVLVVGAGLFLRTFTELAHVELGFQPRGLLLADLDLSKASRDRSRYPELIQELCASARSIEGVASAACSPAVPIGFRAGSAFIVSEKAVWSEPERRAHKNWVSEGWFETFQTRLLAGRTFRAEDRAGAPRVAVVNEAFVERFGNGNGNGGTMLGETVREELHNEGVVEHTIVGVVEDNVYRSIREPAPPTLYVPLAQAERSSLGPWLYVTLRAPHGSPNRLADPLRQAVRAVEPQLPVTVRLLDEQIEATYNQERVLAMVSTLFSGLAITLAALGLFGVTAHTVNCERKAISIRMALGADAGRVIRMVLGRVAALVAIGILAGGLSSLWAARFVDSLLFGTPPKGLSLFLGAAGILVLAAAIATFLPARRACRLDPAGVLRED